MSYQPNSTLSGRSLPIGQTAGAAPAPRPPPCVARASNDLSALIVAQDDEMRGLEDMRASLAAALHGPCPVAEPTKPPPRGVIGVLDATDQLREQHNQRCELLAAIRNLITA